MSKTKGESIMDQILNMNDEYTKQYFKMLDDNRAYMFIIDSATHKILYANKALQKLYGDEVLVNHPCFGILRGNRKACDECPLKTIQAEENGTLNSGFVSNGHHVFFTSSPITLQGRELSLITALDSTEYHRKAVTEISLYHKALLHDALYYYVVDLTDNLILHRPLVNSTRAFPMKLIGKFPMNYDEYIMDWWGVERVDARDVDSTFSDNLLKLYGEGHHSHRAESVTKDGKYHLSKVVLMSEDENTGHICASVIISDITEEYNRQKAVREELQSHQIELGQKEEYLQAFNSCFFTSSHFDLLHNRKIVLNGGNIPSDYWDSNMEMPLQERFDQWIMEELTEEDRQAATQFLNLEQIKNRLREANMISSEFNTRTNGWVCLQLVALRRDEEGEVTDIVCMTRTIDYAKQRELETVRELRKKTAFVNALSKTYFVFSRMDFVNDCLEIMNAGNYEHYKGKNVMPLQETLIGWAQEDLDSNTRKENAFLWNSGMLRESLRDKDVVSLELETKTNGWVDIQVVVLNRDENGEVIDSAWLCRVIDSDKRREIESQQRVAAFAKQYYTSYYMNMIDDTYVEMTAPGYLKNSIASVGNAQEALYYWTDHILAEEFREEVREFVNLSTLEERLRRHELVSVDYINGENLWTRGEFIPVDYEEDGRLKHFIYAARIIESEKRAALEAEKSKQREYESVLAISKVYHTMHVVDVLHDTYEEIWAVEKIHTLLGESGVASEGFERAVQFSCSEEHREKLRIFLDLSTLSERMGANSFVSTEFLTEVGEWYRASFILKKRDITGQIVQVLYVTQDIDEDKEKELAAKEALQTAFEAAEKASAAKTVFLSNMSHDIRTPMNAITGFAAIAASKIDDTERVKDCLKKILSSGEHLQSLINEILDMSRIESGKTQLEVRKTTLPELIRNVMPLIQPQIQAKQLNFYVDTVDVRDEYVFADTLKIRQILTNLLGNSIKFTHVNGTISLRILQRSCNRIGYGAYRIIVKDTGIGMSDEFQNHVFEPFERELSSTLSGTIGTGLGLSITKNLVELMGGTISVKSNLGEGSEFTVDLELELQTNVPVDRRVEELKGLRILVVDDDFQCCDSITKMLSDVGMRSDWTTSERDALLRAQKAHTDGDPFYAYIIDWIMPNMNGIELTRRIRKVIGDDTPIIVLTAYDWGDIECEARDAGVTAFCTKPLFMADLTEALLQCSARKTEEQGESNAAVLAGKRILLVEDNELNREIAVELLTDGGLVVDTAEDGLQAVEKLRDSAPETYALVLMDIQMPVMNGYEATREIRQLNRADLQYIPIVAMTANAFAEDVQASIIAGMNDHLAKPLDMQKVFATLTKYLK